jgi:hypothetical protein
MFNGRGIKRSYDSIDASFGPQTRASPRQPAVQPVRSILATLSDLFNAVEVRVGRLQDGMKMLVFNMFHRGRVTGRPWMKGVKRWLPICPGPWQKHPTWANDSPPLDREPSSFNCPLDQSSCPLTHRRTLIHRCHRLHILQLAAFTFRTIPVYYRSLAPQRSTPAPHQELEPRPWWIDQSSFGSLL